MKYHAFKNQFAEEVAAALGKNCRVMVQEIPKNNGVTKESMIVTGEEGEAVPAIWLEPYFHAYQQGTPVPALVERFLEEYQEVRIPGKQNMQAFLDYEKAASHICYKIINYEKNREWLKELPHRKILDLALVYYYRVEQFDDRQAAIMLTGEHMERWHVTEQQLYEQAKKNTCRLLPVQMSGILQVIQEISEDYEFDEAELMIGGDEKMYVLTNEERYFGAVCFLYPEVAGKISDYFSDNFYILPSSIHECIIVPDSGRIIPQELRELVHDVNCQCVEKEDILSDNVYYYDRVQKKLHVVCGGRELLN